MKSLTKSTRDKSGQIYAQTVTAIDIKAQAHFVSQDRCKTLIRHHQRDSQPRHRNLSQFLPTR
ncbi:hypothetical protein E2C01_045988 [Portunus trituberculatus]|uniref:Uncharacterized protein n=1 Tax=Portunus trituberculatus TaxID=210409 RepID=A0A5B7G3E8_PORTR|nr:hypothetical protein [Portunus trituberculatus]